MYVVVAHRNVCHLSCGFSSSSLPCSSFGGWTSGACPGLGLRTDPAVPSFQFPSFFSLSLSLLPVFLIVSFAASRIRTSLLTSAPRQLIPFASSHLHHFAPFLLFRPYNPFQLSTPPDLLARIPFLLASASAAPSIFFFRPSLDCPLTPRPAEPPPPRPYSTPLLSSLIHVDAFYAHSPAQPFCLQPLPPLYPPLSLCPYLLPAFAPHARPPPPSPPPTPPPFPSPRCQGRLPVAKALTL